MREPIASGIVVVKVYITDNIVGGAPSSQLWAAAVPRDEAVDAVKQHIPAHWTAELTDQRLNVELVQNLRMKLGDVRELSSAR